MNARPTRGARKNALAERNRESQRAYKARQLSLGRRPRVFYLTDEEKQQLSKRLDQIREEIDTVT